MTSSIHDEMLGDMPAMRMAIGLHFKWYYHVTPMRNVAPIRKEGLLPKRDKTAPDIVKKYAGSSASNLICLNPLGADVVPPTVQVGPFACLAIVNEALPMRLSLDWSYGGAFGIAEVLRSENANRPASSIFVESGLSGDPISALSKLGWSPGRTDRQWSRRESFAAGWQRHWIVDSGDRYCQSSCDAESLARSRRVRVITGGYQCGRIGSALPQSSDVSGAR
jgi:hypothetical protein